MIGIGVLLSSVAATALAMLATSSSRLTATFRHYLLLVAIVPVPVGALALGIPLRFSGDFSGLVTGLTGALDGLDFISASEPTRAAVINATRDLALDHVYATVSLVLLLRVMLDVFKTNQRVRSAREVAPSCSEDRQGSSDLSIRKSNRVESPYAWGLIRPVIVVPIDWDDWSREKQLAAISHEHAHIRRRDVLTTLASLLACCLLWMNPIIWLAHRRLKEQAERACDDHVIGCGVEAPRYAGYLVEIARSANPGRPPAMATQSALSRRVHALLDPNTRRSDMPRKYMIMTFTTAFVLMSGSAALGVSATEDTASAATMLRACGQLLPVNSQFVMELSANWNTKPNPEPGEDFELSFTFGDENRPDLVGQVPDELHAFAQCLSKALTHHEIDVSQR